MASRLCPFCMKMTEGDTCSHCGKQVNYAGSPAHLPAGYVVSGKHPYVLGAALGQGGFGITYIALDMVTGQRVAIKEYFPTYCSARTENANVTAYSNQEEVYQKGKERFLDEAKTLKSLSDLPNIVNVLDFFEANNSAYLAMEYLEGSSLKDYAAKNGKFPAQKFLDQLKPLMEDIHRMHTRGVIHRDIAPDNIILLPDGRMKLIDFGAARSYVGDKSMTVVVKKGFAPVEQYMTKGSSASTDVYALAATIYYCITGKVPPDSAARQYDEAPLEAPSALGADITPQQEEAILHSLRVYQKERTQTVQEFLDQLHQTGSPRKNPKPEPKKAVSSGTAPKDPAKDSKSKTPPKKPKSSLSGKKAAAIVAAAILVAMTVFGLALPGRSPEKPSEQQTASTAKKTGAWKQNVLMSDDSFDEDTSRFWADRKSASDEEYHNYISSRPIFGTDIPRSTVTEVFFLDSLLAAPKNVYDVSDRQDRSVLAWTEKTGKGLRLYIAGEGGVNGAGACRVLFHGYTALEAVHFNNCFFTDDATDMNQMFAFCEKLETVRFDGLITKNVTNMGSMFYFCKQLTDLDLSNLDTSNVTFMGTMFSGCRKLASLNLRGFDTAQVTYMQSMFSGCRKLTTLDLSSFNTAQVTNMEYMFSGCSELSSLDLSSFDTSSVMFMGEMFAQCSQLPDLDLSHFDVSNVKKHENFMEPGKTVNGRPWQELFEQNTNNMQQPKPPADPLAWKNNVLMADTTYDDDNDKFWADRSSASDKDISDYLASRPVFNTGIIRSKITEVFFLNSLSAAPENAYDVSDNQEGSVFAWTEENSSGLSLYIAGEGGVNGAKACRTLFAGYTALEAVHFNNSFFTDSTRDMSQMFYYCKNLESISLDGLNTGNVTDMRHMFAQCDHLTAPDLSDLDTSQVTYMNSMFAGCIRLTSLDLRGFDTTQLRYMSYMFSRCNQLKTVDLSSFDTSSVEYMNDTFSWCPQLEDLDLSHFDVSNVKDYTNFMGTDKTVNGRPWRELFA